MPPAPEAGRDPAASSLLRTRLLVPREIGPFRILRQIGEGGMGIVFLAEQERPHRTVALKVVHASVLSPRTLSRFEQEAEVLARLQHPGIAQIYQVGTYATEQGVLPYIAMEYVEGERLDQYASRQGLGARERLELAARLADAVEHAHQKGVIHRDLKPGNVLVTADGQPKILDFGVARLSHDEDTRTTTLRTDAGALLGTLTYMSPEQASGDPHAIDARSDVYSLGVVLFELLTGRLPYYLERSALPEAVRVIREEEPSKLSTHDPELRGDVETIVLKALEKDRERRYPSAAALAADIRRHLTDEPILAHAPSTLYRISKFARRNKLLVGGVAAVGLALAIGAGVATHLWLRERAANAREREAAAREHEARLTAERQEKHAQALSEFLLSLFQGVGPEVAQGADTQLLERILADGRQRLASEFADQPEVEARIRRTIGVVYLDLSRFDEAEADLRRSRELLAQLHGADDRQTLEADRKIANVLERRGEWAAAQETMRATLARQQATLGADDRDALRTRVSLADALMRENRLREAEVMLREALAQQVELGESLEEIESTRMTLAQTLALMDRRSEARELLEATLLSRSQRLGDDHPGTIVALGTLGATLVGLKEYDEAETILRDALSRARHVLGPDNQQTLTLMNNLAWGLGQSGKTVEAEELLRDCLARRRAALGEMHPETLGTHNHLTQFLLDRGRLDEALPLILANVETLTRELGADSWEAARAQRQAGHTLARLDRDREAVVHFEAAAVYSRKLLPADDPDRCRDLYNWAATLQNVGEKDASEPILREALELVAQNELADDAFVPAAKNSLAKVLELRGEHAEADELFEEALAMRRERYGKVHPEVAYSLSDYGESLLERGDAEAALPLLVELVELRERERPVAEWHKPAAQQLLGRCLAALGRFDEAEEQLLPACEAFARLTYALPTAASSARAGILELYARWDEAEPGHGIAARAERWQAEFPAEREAAGEVAR